MLVVLGQVDDVVNGETDQDDHRNGLGDTQFPALFNHDGDYADEDNGDTEDGLEGKEHIAGDNGEDDESEDKGNQNTLLSRLNEGFFRHDPAEVKTS